MGPCEASETMGLERHPERAERAVEAGGLRGVGSDLAGTAMRALSASDRLEERPRGRWAS